MLKRFLLILLAVFLILGCCSCSNNNSNETDPAATEDNTPADKVVLSGDTRYRIVYAKDADPAPAKKIYNRLKALDRNAIADDYYVLTTDETPADNTPEILVGLTNRAESTEAKAALAKCADDADVKNANGVIALLEGNNAEAEKLFKAAHTDAASDNLAIIAVLNGDYKAAASLTRNDKGFNAALIALLNGNTALAAALECECPCAAYLRAIAAARNGDAAGVKKNLEVAKKCEKLAARAAKDIEFAQFN